MSAFFARCSSSLFDRSRSPFVVDENLLADDLGNDWKLSLAMERLKGIRTVPHLVPLFLEQVLQVGVTRIEPDGAVERFAPFVSLTCQREVGP